jgi:hypothetical protein
MTQVVNASGAGETTASGSGHSIPTRNLRMANPSAGIPPPPGITAMRAVSQSEAPGRIDDLWLRDGDIIEVPEK